jgi:hypothetical protein
LFNTFHRDMRLEAAANRLVVNPPGSGLADEGETKLRAEISKRGERQRVQGPGSRITRWQLIMSQVMKCQSMTGLSQGSMFRFIDDHSSATVSKKPQCDNKGRSISERRYNVQSYLQNIVYNRCSLPLRQTSRNPDSPRRARIKLVPKKLAHHVRIRVLG